MSLPRYHHHRVWSWLFQTTTGPPLLLYSNFLLSCLLLFLLPHGLLCRRVHLYCTVLYCTVLYCTVLHMTRITGTNWWPRHNPVLTVPPLQLLVLNCTAGRNRKELNSLTHSHTHSLTHSPKTRRNLALVRVVVFLLLCMVLDETGL